MVGNGLVGDFQLIRPLNGRLLQQEGRQPFVQALPHDLLHQPHDLGESAGHQLIGVVGHGGGLLHEALIDLRGDDPELGVLLRLNGHLELDGAHHAGGGKEAHIPVKQAVEGDLPPLVREDIGPELARFHQEQPGAVHVPVVQNRPPGRAAERRAVLKPVLLVLIQLIPDGKIIRKVHPVSLLAVYLV